ncbi:MAG: hypothetical protein J6D27_07625 [Ruminiclostridium sp.]|nr:hypothetical protein [Ruminiclostridium sp.]
MKKLSAILITIITVLACTISASAEETAPGSSSGSTPGYSDNTTPGISSENLPTGIILTAVPTTLAAGALILSGIVLKKKNK